MRFTAEQYDQVIEKLEHGRGQLAPDGNNCNICGDSGHQAPECRHNPLVMMAEAESLRGSWRCFHCDNVFVTEADAQAHFGSADFEERPPACVEEPMDGVGMIRAERLRQLDRYDSAHDDRHSDGSLAMAAGSIAAAADDLDAPEAWQEWLEDFWQEHAHDRMQQLAIAGALIAAEIDRLGRLHVKD